MTRTALVTGAYGYLGSLIRDRLSAAGWGTIALVRRPRLGDRAVSWSLGDGVPGSLARADALVHCAYDFAPRERADIWRVNVEGSSALLRSSIAYGIERNLVLSSMSAYAGTRQLYGRAKLAIEEVTLLSGGVAVRPGLVYGARPDGMAGMLAKVTRLPLVPLIGGSARQFPVHEDDFAAAIVSLLDGSTWTPEVIGVAQQTPVMFRALLEALAARQGRRCRFVPVPWRAVYACLRLAEVAEIPTPLRADSVLGLVCPAPFVPRSRAHPHLLDSLRPLESSVIYEPTPA
jgi:nucleoside-diphosphate-sugar epimerase